MSLFVDLKYLKLISGQLPLFKQKSDNTYNCRCIICGDSTKKKNKARGYFYPAKNDLYYKCHNCGASMHFGSFLKQFNNLQYNHYALERYGEGLPKNKSHQKIEDKFKMAEPVFEKKEERLIDKILDRVDSLPKEHTAVQFCEKRKIPLERYKSLYYIENVKDVVQLSEKYKDKITGESRENTQWHRLVLNGRLADISNKYLRKGSKIYVEGKLNTRKWQNKIFSSCSRPAFAGIDR